LLACVDFRAPAHLLHPLPLRHGRHSQVQLRAAGARPYLLDPYPFAQPELSFQFPMRPVKGKFFQSSAQFETVFHAAPVEMLSVTVSAN
jgi:hypothetical protein